MADLQKFTWRNVNERLRADRFHLYNDCMIVRKQMDKRIVAHDGGDMTVVWELKPEFKRIDVTDEVIDMLGLTCCNHCERRSTVGSIEDQIEAFISNVGYKAAAGARVPSARDFIEFLWAAGLKVVPLTRAEKIQGHANAPADLLAAL